MLFLLNVAVCAGAFYYSLTHKFLKKCPKCGVKASEDVLVCYKCKYPKYPDFFKRLSMAIAINSACLLVVQIGAYMKARDGMLNDIFGTIIFAFGWMILVPMFMILCAFISKFFTESKGGTYKGIFAVEEEDDDEETADFDGFDIEDDEDEEGIDSKINAKASDSANTKKKKKRKLKYEDCPQDIDSIMALFDDGKISGTVLAQCIEAKDESYFEDMSFEQIKQLLDRLACASISSKQMPRVIDSLKTDDELYKILELDLYDEKLQLKAYHKIKDKDRCIELLKEDANIDIDLRHKIQERIVEPKLARKIALDPEYHHKVRASLMFIYGDEELYYKIINNEKDKWIVGEAISLLGDFDKKIEAFKTLSRNTADEDVDDCEMEACFPILYQQMRGLSWTGDLDEAPYYCDADLIAYMLYEFKFEDESVYNSGNELHVMINHDSEYREDGYWMISTYLDIERLTEDRYTWSIRVDSRLD